MLGKGDREKAIAYWNAAVEHYSGRWQAYCDRAVRFKKLGWYEEALADYEKCFVMREEYKTLSGKGIDSQKRDRAP